MRISPPALVFTLHDGCCMISSDESADSCAAPGGCAEALWKLCASRATAGLNAALKLRRKGGAAVHDAEDCSKGVRVPIKQQYKRNKEVCQQRQSLLSLRAATVLCLCTAGRLLHRSALLVEERQSTCQLIVASLVRSGSSQLPNA